MVPRRRRRFVARRKALGFSQESLACHLSVDRTTVIRWERAETEPQPWLRPLLTQALDVSVDELTELLNDIVEVSMAGVTQPPQPPVPRTKELSMPANPSLDGLRAVVLGTPLSASERQVAESRDLRKATNDAHRLYQRADYDAAAALLSALLVRMDNHARAARVTAAAYLVAAKLATKLGDASLAWLTADRAHRFGLESEQPTLIAAAQYQVACAMLRADRLADAEAVATVAAEAIARTSVAKVVDERRDRFQRELLSAQGTLMLLIAIMAGRRGDNEAAYRHLGQAANLAEQVGRDANYLWTGFGPTNVIIHELSVRVDLGQPKSALRFGERIDTNGLPSVLKGRRSRVHLDLAHAATALGDDRLAVLHLLEAERVADQAVSRNAAAIALLHTLLGRERKNATPGLRTLATRAGVMR